jgi:trehalose 2-sulfotransferase
MNRTGISDGAMPAHAGNERLDDDRWSKPIRRLADHRLDFPGPVPLRKSYVVASTDRSGSTFLCNLLWQTGVLGAPTEYWNFKRNAGLRGRPKGTSVGNQMMERLEATSLADYLTKLLACRTSKNGVFGVKAHSFDFEEALRQYPEMLDRLAPVSFIYIVRQDKVAQAVSMAKAAQTGAWVSSAKARNVNLQYDSDLIAKCLAWVERQDRDWARWFSTHGKEPFVVTYENLTADADRVMRDVVELMGVQNDEPQHVHLPELEKQGDETNEEWVARFRRENPIDALLPSAGYESGETATQESALAAIGLTDKKPSHVFDRYDAIKDSPARPIEGKRLRHRYDAIVDQNRDLFRNARVLEVYSAEGRWSSAVLDAGATHLVGLERSLASVDAAKDAFAKLGIDPESYEFINADVIAALRDFPPEAFDLVFCQDFSRVPDPHLFFHHMGRLGPKHIILDTGLLGGRVPLAAYQVKQRDKLANSSIDPVSLRVVPNHELIRILCDYFGFRWHVVDWRALDITDWTAIRDYERDRRRTYILDRVT